MAHAKFAATRDKLKPVALLEGPQAKARHPLDTEDGPAFKEAPTGLQAGPRCSHLRGGGSPSVPVDPQSSRDGHQRPACGHVSGCFCQQVPFLNMLHQNAESGSAEGIQPEGKSTPAEVHFKKPWKRV